MPHAVPTRARTEMERCLAPQRARLAARPAGTGLKTPAEDP